MSLELRHLLALVRAEPADAAVLKSAREVMRWLSADELTILDVRSVESAAAALDLEAARPDDPDPHTTRMLRVGDAVELTTTTATIEQIDLVIAAESGMVTQRILRGVACAILTLPARSIEAKGPVLAPFDRDQPRLETLQLAAHLALESQTALELLHIYSVPIGYHKLGQTHDQVAAIIRGHAETKADELMRELAQPGLAITARFVLTKASKSIAVAILEEVEARPYSQIVLGGRLRARVAGILFPSISERVVLSSPRPVWVIRDRSEAIGLLETMTSQ
jgi:nucleotide-binding universal stress UspA family protein